MTTGDLTALVTALVTALGVAVAIRTYTGPKGQERIRGKLRNWALTEAERVASQGSTMLVPLVRKVTPKEHDALLGLETDAQILSTLLVGDEWHVRVNTGHKDGLNP